MREPEGAGPVDAKVRGASRHHGAWPPEGRPSPFSGEDNEGAGQFPSRNNALEPGEAVPGQESSLQPPQEAPTSSWRPLLCFHTEKAKHRLVRVSEQNMAAFCYQGKGYRMQSSGTQAWKQVSACSLSSELYPACLSVLTCKTGIRVTSASARQGEDCDSIHRKQSRACWASLEISGQPRFFTNVGGSRLN